MNLPDIKDFRGMSEPVFFSFNSLPGGKVVAHGVIVTSLELHPNSTVHVGSLDEDPRLQHLKDFVLRNYGKAYLKLLDDQITSKEKLMQSLDSQIKHGKELAKQYDAVVNKCKEMIRTGEVYIPKEKKSEKKSL